MKVRSWTVIIDDARIDVEFTTAKGKVKDFSVNLSYIKAEEAHPVIRYDTAHGYAHVHRYWISTERLDQEKLAGRDYGELLTEALSDISRNYQRYIELFKSRKEDQDG